MGALLAGIMVFLPTPSARRATGISTVLWSPVKLFLPTPSARRATPAAPRAKPSS